MPDKQIHVDSQPLSRHLTSSFQGNTGDLDQKADDRILETAISQLAGRPGFNPAAISVVFGLKC